VSLGGSANGGFEDFVALLRSRITLPADPVGRDARLAEDLGFDSIAMFELLVMLEETGGRDVPDGVIDNIETVGQAFDWFVDLAVQGQNQPAIDRGIR
jgi:acyl carrier protein